MRQFREIERKFVVKDSALCQVQVDTILRSLVRQQTKSEINGDSADYYYLPRKGVAADFVRRREFPNGHAELTVKRKDMKSNLNRLEINVAASAKESEAFCEAAFGESVAKIQKAYTVFFCSAPDVVVSTYVVEGVDAVYVEVEASTSAIVHEMTKALKAVIELVDEPRSLFEIYVEPKIRPSLMSVMINYKHR